MLINAFVQHLLLTILLGMAADALAMQGGSLYIDNPHFRPLLCGFMNIKKWHEIPFLSILVLNSEEVIRLIYSPSGNFY